VTDCVLLCKIKLFANPYRCCMLRHDFHETNRKVVSCTIRTNAHTPDCTCVYALVWEGNGHTLAVQSMTLLLPLGKDSNGRRR
jgi:hypothetical protein